jgi:hypothetical protein
MSAVAEIDKWFAHISKVKKLQSEYLQKGDMEMYDILANEISAINSLIWVLRPQGILTIM